MQKPDAFQLIKPDLHFMRLRWTMRLMLARKHLYLIAFMLFTACGTTSQQLENVEMDPLAFRAVRGPDGVIRVQTEDLGESYAKAEKALEAGEFQEAATAFQAVADLIPEGTMGRAARYNAAFCYEAAKMPEHALAQYLLSLKLPPEQRTDSQIRIRIAYQYEALARWEELASVLQPVSARQVPNIQRLELSTLIGVAYKGQKKWREADRWLREAIHFWRRHQDDTVVKESPIISHALFALAGIMHQKFLDQALRLPLDRMKEDLKNKGNLFEEAQQAYLDVVRQRDLGYKIKAGYAIGVMYEEFYDDLLKAEIPSNLDAEDRALYFNELRRKIRVLLFKAGGIYKTTLERAGLSRAQFQAANDTSTALRSVQKRICIDLSCPEGLEECTKSANERCQSWFKATPALEPPEWLSGVWEEQWPDRECEDMAVIEATKQGISLNMSSCEDGRHYTISDLTQDEGKILFKRTQGEEKPWHYELRRDGSILVGIAKRGAKRHAIHWKRAQRISTESSHAKR